VIAAATVDPAGGVSVVAAIAAGAVSFLSPCVLPLVPGYLSAVVGLAPADLGRASKRRVLVPSLLFVASFSFIFVLLGVGATLFSSSFATHRQLLDKLAAAAMIALGAFFVASTVVTRLNRQWHVDALVQRAGRGGPLVTGAAFALAWTPCVGPTLGAILSAAALSSSAMHGAVLLAFYAAGLAIPFLATAVAFERMTSLFAVVKRHFRLVIATGGVVLIAMGVLVWSGELFQLNIQAQTRSTASALTSSTRYEPNESGDEAALLASAQAGDERAFEELVRRHSPRLRRVLIRITRDPEAAHDAAQDALIRAWRSIGSFGGRSSFFTWLTRIGINEAYRTIRRNESRRTLPLDDAIGERIPSWGSQPEEVFESREFLAATEAALARLPLEYREAVVLRDVEGLSTAEAAEALGIGERALKSRLHRGRMALRRELDAFFA
jgi:cytochrome c-type biogenesis protein